MVVGSGDLVSGKLHFWVGEIGILKIGGEKSVVGRSSLVVGFSRLALSLGFRISVRMDWGRPLAVFFYLEEG